MKERVVAFFESHREEATRTIVELTRELVACRTVNAGRARLKEFPYLELPGQEARAARVVADRLDSWAIPYQLHEGAPGRANIIATLGAGRPTLMVGCHLDTVPPGDEKSWATPPFEVIEKDGTLYGRGVLDNLGPLASSLVAAWLLKGAGVALKGAFQVAGIASEEFREPGEEDPGIEFLLKRKLISPDMAIIPDIGEQMRQIDIAEKGRMVLRLRTIGRQAHGSTPERGLNAALMMARVLSAIEKLELPHQLHPVLGSPSMNLGIVRGGEAANIVPASCEAELDVRFVPGQTVAGVQEAVAAAARTAIAPYLPQGGQVTVSVDSSSVPHAIAADHQLVRAVQACTRTILGFTPEPFGIGGGTFAKAFNLGGIPAIGFGPGRDDQFHVVDERIETRELVDFSLLCALIACDLLS